MDGRSMSVGGERTLRVYSLASLPAHSVSDMCGLKCGLSAVALAVCFDCLLACYSATMDFHPSGTRNQNKLLPQVAFGHGILSQQQK